MAKKHKHHAAASLSAAELRARTERARQEGRSQQALELAKQLYKQEATPAHQQLLLSTYLDRARQLRGQGQLRDAATTLQAAIQRGGGSPEWVEQVAQELAACGDVKQAMEVMRRLPESPAHAGVLAHAVDAAVQQEAAGRNLLPPDLHEDFHRILRALTQTEAGQDEAARETVQSIGLRSPFLEWKLMIRGLSAYYQQEDARAVENWQRLSPDRLPAQLIAPLRFRVDAGFRTAQPPETQNALQKRLDRIQGSGALLPLRQIQSALAGRQSLPEAFRLAEGVVPALRQQAPHLAARLAACFYWAVIHEGERGDLPRYQRIFGPPANDPKLERLEALASEHREELDSAHQFWQKYEKTVASVPGLFPADQVDRVRALIWRRMGRNATLIPDEAALKDLPPFLRDHPNRPPSLKPGAAECYKRSLELAPDQVATHEDLFHFWRGTHNHKKAAQAAEALLARVPQHVPILDEYGDLCMETHDYGRAAELYRQALQANPLDRRLRQKVGDAHLFHARTLAEAGQFPEARTQYQAALAFEEQGNNASVFCKWAACEFKAGDTARAEELLQQALVQQGNHLAVAYSMVIEAIRLKLKRPLKQRFDQEFNTALAEPPTAAGAAATAETTAAHIRADITYHGQKTHQKKVLSYLEKARTLDFDEPQLERICAALCDLKMPRHLDPYALQGQRRFPQNPYFYYIVAQGLLNKGPHAAPFWKVRPLLEKARELASALPPDQRQKELLERIQKGLEMTSMGNPLMKAFEMLMGGGFVDFGDEYEEDEYDDDWDGYDEGPSGFGGGPFGFPFGGGGGGGGRKKRRR